MCRTSVQVIIPIHPSHLERPTWIDTCIAFAKIDRPVCASTSPRNAPWDNRDSILTRVIDSQYVTVTFMLTATTRAMPTTWCQSHEYYNHASDKAMLSQPAATYFQLIKCRTLMFGGGVTIPYRTSFLKVLIQNHRNGLAYAHVAPSLLMDLTNGKEKLCHSLIIAKGYIMSSRGLIAFMFLLFQTLNKCPFLEKSWTQSIK